MLVSSVYVSFEPRNLWFSDGTGAGRTTRENFHLSWKGFNNYGDSLCLMSILTSLLLEKTRSAIYLVLRRWTSTGYSLNFGDAIEWQGRWISDISPFDKLLMLSHYFSRIQASDYSCFILLNKTVIIKMELYKTSKLPSPLLRWRFCWRFFSLIRNLRAKLEICRCSQRQQPYYLTSYITMLLYSRSIHPYIPSKISLTVLPVSAF